MKFHALFIVPLAAALSASAQSAKSDILAAKPRSEVIANAESILLRRNRLSDELPASLKNPFNPASDDSQEKVKVQSARTDRELIAALASQLQPTGSAERDGERFLLLGQRKVKVGDRVPILFENSQYEVEICGIEGGTFSIRHRNEEFTRPIKPGKNQ
jgi:hypothetical protein